MKKIVLVAVALALVLSMAVTFAACGGSTPTDTTNNGSITGPGTDGTNNPQTPAGTGSTPTTNTPGTPGTPVVDDDKVNFKFFKMGKANATLIRSGNTAILIDCGEEEDEDGNGKQDDGEKILEYLAEKGVTEIDYFIISQFNKNHYGSVPTILNGVTVKKILEPNYTKTGNLYNVYRDAVAKSGVPTEVITKDTTITADGLNLTIYPATKAGLDTDEYYSLAVAVDSEGLDVLVASDVSGARTTALIQSLNGKKFDILQVPAHGEYNDTVESLITATAPKYAVIFASANNPEDARLVKILNDKKITTFVTKNGSVEAKFKNDTLTVKQ
ncbi:MAG: MBL fold metallo-hydrolase [Clostridia bacterium]|nr:MBL fold metallo-hydrolase [Clostridia bacterium]